MSAADPYAVLGVARDADQSAIHAAYRRAVRRTHPDAGGSVSAFEAVQEAYETLRDDAPHGVPAAEAPGRAAPRRQGARPAPSPGSIEDLLAESQRLEDEARDLAGLPPRYGDAPSAADDGDSLAAILRDAGQQLRQAADAGARELRRRARRLL